jgi:hypothetical protein
VIRAGGELSLHGSIEFLRHRESQLRDASLKEPCALGEKKSDVVPRSTKAARTWTPPEVGSLKINVDGAFQQATGEAVIGVRIRDHDGNPKLLA